MCRSVCLKEIKSNANVCIKDMKDSQALFIKAFSKLWDFDGAWIFSPPSLIPRVLNHINSAQRTYRWQKVVWRVDLKRRAVAPPFQIRNLQHHRLNVHSKRPLPGASIFGGLGILEIVDQFNKWLDSRGYYPFRKLMEKVILEMSY